LWKIVKGNRLKIPERLSATLQPILDRLDAEGHFGIVRLMKVWPEVVGDTIARRTEIQSLKFHTAVVKVSGAMWIQELNLMRAQILARLRQALGDDTVRELRFVKGTLRRRQRPKLRPVARETRHFVALPELKDPELRRAFESLIEAWGRASR
jgi:predicted nucleic acid-binding Zn ribbon protein